MLLLLLVAACDYPTGDWPIDSARRAARPEQVAALEDSLFTLTGKPADRTGPRTNALLIAQCGAIVYEKYARGWDETKRHQGWSVTKSITSALTGVAVMQNKITLDTPVIRDGWKIDPTIKIRHLLELSPGLVWQELYENQSNQASSPLALLYGVGHADRAKFVAEQGQAAEPGARFNYSTGTAVLLAAAVQRAAAAGDENWPWTALFEPIGMSSAVFERDAAGTLSGGSHFYATPRDYLKFGALYLQDGFYNGGQILPTGWVHDSTALSPAFAATADSNSNGTQGWLWWANKKRALDEQLPWPDIPEDSFRAEGHWGQSITVIPSLDLIIVRTADDRDDGPDENQWLRRAVDVGRP